MLVVSDTSPIRALSTIDQLALIPAIYGRVLVPPAVVKELSVPVAKLPGVLLSDHVFLTERSLTDAQQVEQL